jgi:RND superfamily putative drug exporter
MGRANWWLPGWLDRVLPHLSVETDPVPPAPRPVPVAVPAQSSAASSAALERTP